MNRLFYSAASGLSTAQNALGVTGNNLANANSVGFQSQRANFSDLIYEHITEDKTKISLGSGTKINSVTTTSASNGMQETGGTFDVAINGDGYFCVKDQNGHLHYTKAGDFKLSTNGNNTYLVTANGDQVLDKNMNPIQIKSQNVIFTGPYAKAVNADSNTDNEDIADTENNNKTNSGAITIQLAVCKFDNPYALTRDGEGMLSATNTSGAGKIDAAATVRQGALSSSNVDMTQEMANLIQTQRGFQLGAQALKTADELEQMANTLR